MKTDLFQQNLTLLETRGCGAIANKMRNLADPLISLTGSVENNDLNIQTGRGEFYQGGAISFSKEQVAAYLKKPNRFCVNPPMLDSVYVTREANVYRDLIREFGAVDPEKLDQPNSKEAGYMVSFGLGLGFHLPDLVRELPVRSIVIAEQYYEMLYLSLGALDWQPIFDTLQQRGGGVEFAFDSDPAILANKIFDALRGKNFGLIDGSYGFQHYASPLLNQVHGLFREMLPALGTSNGFFDDECVMFKHCLENLADNDHALFHNTPHTFQKTSVFVVGSGPSVDQDMEHIRKYKDQVVIISCGTALGALLREGIKPHIHCETENDPLVYEVIENHRSIDDFEGITLITSPTVDPRIPREFDDVIFTHRESLTPTLLFAEEENVLTSSGPTVANVASRIALGLGTREIYFFGIDLGAISPSKHHSKQSIYTIANDSFWNSGFGMLDLDIPIEGNFRQSVFSNATFIYIRSYFHALIDQNPRCRFINCSDGAKILGAIAQRAENISPQITEGIDLRQLLTSTFSLIARDEAEEQKRMKVCAEYLEEQEKWFSTVLGLLSDENGPLRFDHLYDQLALLLDAEDQQQLSSAQLATRHSNCGTFMLMIQFGYFYLRRLPPDRAEEFTQAFKRAARTELTKMRNEITELITKNT